MKYFEAKMSYPQFLKYLVPSVLTMIFLSLYTTIDVLYHGMQALTRLQELILLFRSPVLFSEHLSCLQRDQVPS